MLLGTTVLPEQIHEEATAQQPFWIVTVYNNDYNTYEEVIGILMAATGCNFEEGYMEAWEVDHLGLSVVHRADEAECRKAAEIIATIGIRVQATPEP